MTRSRFLNRFRKNRTEKNRLAYQTQRNYCVKLLKKSKQNFYNNLDVKQVTDNRLFWRTIKPNFSDKIKKNENIILVENDKIISDELEIAETFNNYFGNIISDLGIKNDNILSENSDPVINAISYYENHPSINKIKDFKEENSSFNFVKVTLQEVREHIGKLDNSKSMQSCDIPTKVIKENSEIFARYITAAFNDAISSSIFPKSLKFADIKPIFKKNSRTDKENYRPISILPNLSKVFEKILFRQMTRFLDLVLSKK